VNVTRKVKSGRIIIINSILMLVFITILIVQNIYFLDKNNTIQSNIDKTYNQKIDVIMRMSKVVRERSLHMVTMYLSDDDWEKDRIFIDFHKLKLVFLKYNAELKSLGLYKDEQTIFDDIILILDRTELIQIDIVERIQSGGDKNVRSDISKKDLPLETKVLGLFESLIDVTKNNTNKARESAKQQYRESMLLIVAIAVLVFVIIIYLMRRSLSQIEVIETGLIKQAETLSWDATHDALTNVYNRRWLQHKFELLAEEQAETKTKHSLLYIDLDEFKPINDNYGHVVGDKFLCGITREFEKCIRQNDILARMGGDEFAILLENCDVKQAQLISACLVKRVKKFSITIEKDKICIAGCSVGIKEFFTADFSFDELIKQADSACYEAKKNNKNQRHKFSPA